MVRPRFMVWENVPGAFSSGKPKGADFAAVLEEIVKVCEPGADVCVPVPDKGWTKAGCYYADDGAWSIAWRVHDAQFWGVPQRRKRIALVADFGGLSAPELLFERKGLRGDIETGGAPGEEAAAGAGGDAEGTITTVFVPYGSRLGFHENGVASTLTSIDHKFPQCVSYQASGDARCWSLDEKMGQTYVHEDMGNTLGARDYKQPQAVCYDARGNGDGEIAPTMTGDHQSRVTDYTALCVSNVYGSDVIPSLVASAYKGPGNTQDGYCVVTARGPEYDKMPIVFDKEMYNAGEKMSGEPLARYDEVAPTVREDSHPSGVCTSVVRRLTPLECERLQGFPDGWTDIGEWTDSKGKKHKDADSPRYKALGNSIALPFWAWLARRICAQYERPMTMGSLFDGIGGFPLVFERAGARAVWASEIEEFPIAVTKLRFPESERPGG